MAHFEYLIVILIVLLPTVTLTFHPRSKIRTKFIPAIYAITISSIPFLIWDVWATMNSHWEFNKLYTLGLNIGVLPFEEILFFVAVPYSCLFLWNVISNFTSIEELKKEIMLK